MNGVSLLPYDGIAHGVLELLKGAKDHATLVTPYLQPWRHLRDAILDAASRGTSITLIIRSDQVEKSAPLLALCANAGLEVRRLERLHAKIYATDSAAILTSMNLVETSALNSWEAGLHISARDAADLFAGVVGQIEAMRAKSEVIEALGSGTTHAGADRRRRPGDRRIVQRSAGALIDPGLERRLAALEPLKTDAELSPEMSAARRNHPRAYEAYSPEEDAILRDLGGKGASFEEIAALVKRQPSAIRSRLQGFLATRERDPRLCRTEPVSPPGQRGRPPTRGRGSR